jgi:hypothetical protein
MWMRSPFGAATAVDSSVAASDDIGEFFLEPVVLHAEQTY